MVHIDIVVDIVELQIYLVFGDLGWSWLVFVAFTRYWLILIDLSYTLFILVALIILYQWLFFVNLFFLWVVLVGHGQSRLI